MPVETNYVKNYSKSITSFFCFYKKLEKKIANSKKTFTEKSHKKL